MCAPLLDQEKSMCRKSLCEFSFENFWLHLESMYRCSTSKRLHVIEVLNPEQLRTTPVLITPPKCWRFAQWVIYALHFLYPNHISPLWWRLVGLICGDNFTLSNATFPACCSKAEHRTGLSGSGINVFVRAVRRSPRKLTVSHSTSASAHFELNVAQLSNLIFKDRKSVV